MPSDLARPLPPPPSEGLGEARLRYLLQRCEVPESAVTAEWMADVVALAQTVSEHRDGIRTSWHTGGVRVWAVRFGMPARAWAYACDASVVGLAPHIGAVMLCRLWADPDWHEAFERPLWLLELGPLVDAAARAPVVPQHDGRMRYELAAGDAGRAPMRITALVERRAKRGGGWLRPRKAPGELAALRALVPLQPCDEALHEALAHLALLERRAAGEWQGGTGLSDARAFVARGLLVHLASAESVWVEGEEVTASAVPVTPRLALSAHNGGYALRWSPRVRAVWADGVLLTEQGALRPVGGGFPMALLATLVAPLPWVPADGAAGFVRAAVVEAGLDVELDEALPGLRDPDGRTARVVLEEREDALRVRLVARYLVGRERVELDAGVGPGVFDDPALGLVRRDWPWERALAERFTALAGATAPLLRSGDGALDFMADTLPRLREQWEIYGERALTRLQFRGPIGPRVLRGEGGGLGVVFGDERGDVAAAPVLRSWLEGKRYTRLDDGAMVQLPERWLARHGHDALALEAATAAGASPLLQAWLARDLAAEEPAELSALRPAAVPELPPGLQATLRPYQLRGVAWLQAMADGGLGGVLADDMGLGKTLQTLCLLAGRPTPSLVVAPTSVLHGWVDEAARFLPGMRVVAFHGSGRSLPAPADVDVVVTTHALLRIDCELLAERHWSVVVLDEAQAIKNADSQIARAARALSCDARFALSGTPVENRLEDLWSVLGWAVPGLLGDRASFKRRVAGPIERQGSSKARLALQAAIRPFLLRRLKSDVLTELPPKSERELRVALSDSERALYDRVRSTYRASVEARIAEHGLGGTRLHILEALTRLRQAACHPGLLPFAEVAPNAPSAKLDCLDELLQEAVSSGHRTLVFSQWPSLLARVRARLTAQEIATCWLDGTTTNRAEEVARFQSADGPPVFLISLKAGGTGLTLTAADHVVLLDPWWNPAVEDQATDRAHRIGQTRPVLVHRIVAKDTVEEAMLVLQQHKRRLASAVLDAGEADEGDLDAVQAALEELGLS